MAISFIFCYARSGGTLLNRCLSNIDDLVVLSEVHPINSITNRDVPAASVAWQAKKWYGIDLKSTGYVNQIEELDRWCGLHGKHLVIRDWSFIDFTPNHLNDFSPSNISTSFQLLKEEVELNCIAFVRDAIDVGLSRKGNVDVFSEAYLAYIEFLLSQKIKIFKYEDFCKNPDRILQDIGVFLSFPGAFSMQANCDSDKVIGDTNISRGNVNLKISEMKRRYALPSTRKKINGNLNISKANTFLGYSAEYEAVEAESMQNALSFYFKNFFIKLKKLIQNF